MVSPYVAPLLPAGMLVGDKSMNASLNAIEGAVCTAFGFAADEMRYTRRDRVAKARQTFFWLAARYTTKSYAIIGLHYMKDHSTVHHACKTIDNLIFTKDKDYYSLIRRAHAILIDKCCD